MTQPAMKRLLIARHGNTFAPGDTVVTVGSRNDLPLVDKGMAQAVALGEALARTNRRPTVVFAGPLQRQYRFAEIVLQTLQLDLPVRQDARLNEIDFGDWTGLSDQQIQDRFGAEEFAAWHQRSEFPGGDRWGESEAQVIARVADFCRDLPRHLPNPKDCALVVSSNGALRYFLRLVPGLFDQRNGQAAVRMKTGHVSEFVQDEAGWRLNLWDQNPANLESSQPF